MNGDKKNILINAGPLHNQSAGIHVWTKEFLLALHQITNTFQIILLTEKPTKEFPNFKTIIVPTFKWLPGFATLRYFLIFPIIARLIKADYFLEPAHFGPFNLPKKIKKITVIHDLTPILFKEWHQFNSWFLQQKFLPGILKRADLILTVSDHTQNDLLNYVPTTKGKIQTLYPGVGKFFKTINQPKDPNQTPYLLYTGTIEPRKNLETLVKAFDIIKEMDGMESYQLWIIGKKGWKNESFEKALSSSTNRNSILLKGFVTKEVLLQAYQNCSAFVYPSLYEGFGFPILEALACGTRVITSQNSSLQEIAGSFATLVIDPLDPKELAQSIFNSLQQPIPDPDAIQEHLKQFSWNQTAKRFLNIINQDTF
jgi:glycosyltransferase involved in cell wall biosynthesis